MAVTMTASHLGSPAGGFEPQRSYNWVLVLPGTSDPDLIRLSVERVSLPSIGTAVIHMRYMNEDIKVSGGASVDANSITVRDFVDRQTYATLNAWMEQVHDPATGAIGFASDYKKQGTLQLVDPKGNVMRQIIVKGVWPNKISATDLDYNSDSGLVKINLQLSVDKYDLTGL